MTSQELCRLQDYTRIKSAEKDIIGITNSRFDVYTNDGFELTAKGVGLYYKYNGNHLAMASGYIPLNEAEQWERFTE